MIDLNGRHYPGGSGLAANGNLSGSSENIYGNWKKAYEQDWQNKIRAALAYIPGVVVTPNVELEIETAHEESKTTYDPKSVVFNMQENTTSKLVKSVAPGGRPGAVAQGGITQANQPAMLQQASGPETNEETANVVTSNAVPSSTTRIQQHGLTPKAVTVQVGIPTSYYEKIWSERNPATQGQAVKKPDANAITDIETKVKIDVERAVVALLPPVPATVDRFPRVNVTSFTPIAPLPISGPTMPDKALAWLGQYWTTLGLVGVGLFSLVLLRGMIQAVPATPPPAAAASSPGLSLVTPEETDSEPASSEPASARSRLKRRGATGPSLRDELTEIVKEDPEAAVAILRTWIGSAS